MYVNTHTYFTPSHTSFYSQDCSFWHWPIHGPNLPNMSLGLWSFPSQPAPDLPGLLPIATKRVLLGPGCAAVWATAGNASGPLWISRGVNYSLVMWTKSRSCLVNGLLAALVTKEKQGISWSNSLPQNLGAETWPSALLWHELFV